MSRASTHFVGEKVGALSVASGARSGGSSGPLPLVATGGWDNQTNHVALHVPVLPSLDERSLHDEFRAKSGAQVSDLAMLTEAPHEGDVAALQFVGAGDALLLLSASSAGGVRVFRVRDEERPALEVVSSPQWETLFRGYGATGLDAVEGCASVVSVSGGGAIAWLSLDEQMSVTTIENKDASRLALNAVKLLGSGSVAATAGSAPGSQLRIWDITANNQFPVAVASDPKSSAALTAVETHPTRPELLVTGADDGRVCLWDRRRLDAPFRTETRHVRAVRAVKLHAASPRFLFSAGDDAVVRRWDFHHERRDRDAVEYERRSSAGLALSTANGFGGHDDDGLRVETVAKSDLPWNALAVHAESDTVVAGSDAQSVVLIQNASKRE